VTYTFSVRTTLPVVLVFFSAHHILWLSFRFYFVTIPANIFVQQQPVDFRTAAIEVRPIGNFSFL
jgi:hypothetical protein